MDYWQVLQVESQSKRCYLGPVQLHQALTRLGMARESPSELIFMIAAMILQRLVINQEPGSRVRPRHPSTWGLSKASYLYLQDASIVCSKANNLCTSIRVETALSSHQFVSACQPIRPKSREAMQREKRKETITQTPYMLLPLMCQ